MNYFKSRQGFLAISAMLTLAFFSSAAAEEPECYLSETGDFICPQPESSASDTKPGIGTHVQPAPVVSPKPPVSQVQQATEPKPVTTNNAASAYTWPSGFGCQSLNKPLGPPPVGQKTEDWGMTFKEEFNAFDTNIWNDTIWYQESNPTKNYTVEEGALKIWPQRDTSGNFFNRTIDTDGKYYQTYGYFEMEAKLPVGKGTWPAFWLFNHIGSARPEMDIMEAYPGGGPDSGWGDKELHPVAFAVTVWPGNGSNAGHKMLQTPDLSTDFHTYAVKWEPNKQTYYFDGKPFFDVDVSMHDPMYIMLDLWFGSASGDPDDTTPQGKENSYIVNYVRAWEKCSD